MIEMREMKIKANLGGWWYRWQLERALYYEMAVVYGVFCGTYNFRKAFGGDGCDGDGEWQADLIVHEQ